MVVQSIQSRKLVTTDEGTFVSTTVPGSSCGHCLDVLVARQSDHGFGDHVVAVESLYLSIDLMAIETRRAIAGFEMNGQAGRGGVGALAPRASDVASLMDARMHVLRVDC